MMNTTTEWAPNGFDLFVMDRLIASGATERETLSLMSAARRTWRHAQIRVYLTGSGMAVEQPWNYDRRALTDGLCPAPSKQHHHYSVDAAAVNRNRAEFDAEVARVAASLQS